MDERLFTVKEVAQKLKMSEESVRRLLRSKKLQGHIILGAYRVSQQQLDDFLRRTLNTNQLNQES